MGLDDCRVSSTRNGVNDVASSSTDLLGFSRRFEIR